MAMAIKAHGGTGRERETEKEHQQWNQLTKHSEDPRPVAGFPQRLFCPSGAVL